MQVAMANDAPSTMIVNKTKKALDMKVGNHHYFEDFISVPQGAKHTMRVDYNDTYQEILIGVDESGKRLIVTSDDCFDYKCITITEVDGHFDVHKVPRRQPKPPTPEAQGRPAKKLKPRRVPVKKLKLLFTWGLVCQ